MKKLFSAVLCLCICVCLSSCTSTDDRSDSIGEYERGWDDGYNLGYYDGYEEGTKSGSDEDKYKDGYNDGNNDGYYAGATYTCLFYGDVDRAIRSAHKGSAWYTFIDAYDQYVSNIYDDSETRSELFWALVSATISKDATDEEIGLLYSTFGKELFTRNDISLNPQERS